MFKNSIGKNIISHKTFQIKEWLKVHIPNKNTILDFIKYRVDSFIKFYNEYRFLLLFLFWIIINYINDNYIVNTIAVLTMAVISLFAKYISFLIDRFYLTKDFSNGIKQLDILIADSIQEYCLMNGMIGTTFISDNEETKLRNEVTNLVVAKLSDQLIIKLKTQYNANSVHEIIATRIYIIVMNFVSDINKDKPSSDNSPTNDQFDMSKFLTNNSKEFEKQ